MYILNARFNFKHAAGCYKHAAAHYKHAAGRYKHEAAHLSSISLDILQTYFIGTIYFKDVG